jgi:glycosyltransferase involved in cell wall biosynthesis
MGTETDRADDRSGDDRDLPFVTVIMPVRNEEDFIARSLSSVLRQSYPSDRFEVIVVDGSSQDSTPRIVREQAATAAPRVELLDNPREVVPISLNMGLKEAAGDIVVRVDGHCEIPSDYLHRCVTLLQELDADCVGGRLETIGEGSMANAIAVAQGSRFGVGGVAFRSASRAGYVDTLAFGAYRREVFDRIGVFDEELVRNQDDEFNFRLTQSGGRIWLDPTLVSRYYSRPTLRRLWKQYREYGFYKVFVIRKHHAVPAFRHLVPVAFVSALAVGAIGSVVSRSPKPMGVVVMPWLGGAIVASVVDGRRNPRLAPLLLPVYATLHLAYGLGFLQGLRAPTRGPAPTRSRMSFSKP